MVCENCPNSLLNNFINNKKTAKADLDKLQKELKDCRLRDKFSGRGLFIEDQLLEAQSLYDTYDEITSDALVQAVPHCDGPYERVERISGDRKYVSGLCGAEVLAKQVARYGRVESAAEPEERRLSDDTPA